MTDDTNPQPIGVIGVGWVGLVTAVCFAELGNRVIALDILEAKVEALRRGEVTIHEPGLPEMLARNADRLEFTTSMDDVLAQASLLFCCVDTPPTYSGDADLSRVRSVVDELPEGGRHALVMKSTVPSGTGAAIRRDRPGLAYVSCPEFLKEGSAIDDFMEPDRVVIGADEGSEWAADGVEALYRPLGGELVRTDVASAEMIKLASNAFLATKISFINEIANVCEQTGADVIEVARGMGLDNRIGPSFLNAGVGYGGSCFDGATRLRVRMGGVEVERSIEALWHEIRSGDSVEVLSWIPGDTDTSWMPVECLTRRDYDGEMVTLEVGGAGHGGQARQARRASVTATVDHPFIARASDPSTYEVLTLVEAGDLSHGWALPLVLASEGYSASSGGYEAGGDVMVLQRTVGFASVTRCQSHHHTGHVYSLEVPGSHTVVVNDGLISHNCFPKDVSALKQLAGNSGYHFQLLNAVIEVNELQKRRVVAKLEKHLGSLVGKRIALLGLAFKPNTDDMREATSLVLSARLQGEGATVAAYDPVAETSAGGLLPSVEMADSAAAALEGADAAVLVTEWAEFRELDWESLGARMAKPLLVDGRNFLDAESLRAAGFTYEGIGRPNGGVAT
jgi:UDP-glucose 6-dehydrogenase